MYFMMLKYTSLAFQSKIHSFVSKFLDSKVSKFSLLHLIPTLIYKNSKLDYTSVSS